MGTRHTYGAQICRQNNHAYKILKNLLKNFKKRKERTQGWRDDRARKVDGCQTWLPGIHMAEEGRERTECFGLFSDLHEQTPPYVHEHTHTKENLTGKHTRVPPFHLTMFCIHYPSPSIFLSASLPHFLVIFIPFSASAGTPSSFHIGNELTVVAHTLPLKRWRQENREFKVSLG